MTPLSVKAVYFSPAGNTEKTVKLIADTIAKNFGIDVSYVDFTPFCMRGKSFEFGSEDIVVFGMPVYAGRLPNKLVSAVRGSFKGKGTPAVSVVTFGNRGFDNALKELSQELSALGFNVAAGAAVVGEHTFCARIAPSRPDAEDAADIRVFAGEVCEKLKKGDMRSPDIPGDAKAPYYTPLDENGEPAVFLKARPKTRRAVCRNCKKCAAVCPMGCVSYEDTALISGTCIKCHACIKNCPENAKYFDDTAFLSHVRMLEKNYTEKNKSSFFI